MQRKREPGQAWSCLQTKQFQERIVGAFSNEAASKKTKQAEQDRLLARESSYKEDKGSSCVLMVSCVAKISVLRPRPTNVQYFAVMG